jgi:hypothetical protein
MRIRQLVGLFPLLIWHAASADKPTSAAQLLRNKTQVEIQKQQQQRTNMIEARAEEHELASAAKPLSKLMQQSWLGKKPQIFSQNENARSLAGYFNATGLGQAGHHSVVAGDGKDGSLVMNGSTLSIATSRPYRDLLGGYRTVWDFKPVTSHDLAKLGLTTQSSVDAAFENLAQKVAKGANVVMSSDGVVPSTNK